MALAITVNKLSLRSSPASPQILHELSLHVPAHTCCAILGPTGAGKSSLLQALSGSWGFHHRTTHASGSISIGPHLFTPLPSEILFPTVGLALQDPSVQISGIRSTVSDELLFTLENLDLPTDERRQYVVETMQQLKIEHLASRKPTELSGGELHRVALATILVARPEVLLLDEPTTSLDYSGQRQLIRFLRTVRTTTTVILSETSLDFAVAVADQIVILDKGRVRMAGSKLEVLRRLPEVSSLLPTQSWHSARSVLERTLTKGDAVASKISKSLNII